MPDAVALPAASNGVEATFNRQPKFSGTATKATPATSDDCSPLAFVREIETRRLKYGWSDEATMQHVKGMFTSTAADWLFQGLLTQKSQPVWDVVTSSWKLFLPIFKAKFGITEEIRNISLAAIDGQRKNETASRYMDRILESMHDFRFLQMSSGDRAPQDGIGVLAVIPVSARVVTKLESNRDLLKDIDESMANAEFRAAHHQFNQLLGGFTMRLLSHGFTSTHLKQEAARLLRTNPTLDKFVTEMVVIIHQEIPVARTAKVAEISDNNEDSKDTDSSVNAISRDSKKTDSGNAANGRTDFKKNLKCHYCKRKGHFIRDCRTRQAAEASKAKSNGSASSAPSNGSNPGSSNPPLAAILAPMSGNANGPW